MVITYFLIQTITQLERLSTGLNTVLMDGCPFRTEIVRVVWILLIDVDIRNTSEFSLKLKFQNDGNCQGCSNGIFMIGRHRIGTGIRII